jgi:hypothetical protein
MILNSPIISGSLTVTGNIIASGSITLSGSVASASYAASSTSASYALNATTASYADALIVAGTLTAQTLVVQTITSSVDFVTGSTRFGSIADNTHVFTGSVSISGSTNITSALSGSSATFSSNVNIGMTTNDYARLAVKSNSTNYYAGFNVYAPGNNNFIALTHDNNVGWVTTEFATGGTGFTPLAFGVGNTERMRITTSGSVGIGTTNPTFAAGSGLAISDASRSNLTLTDGTNVYNLFQTGNDAYTDLRTTGSIIWRTTSGNTERMRITSEGSVGIGTNSPSYFLDVVKNASTFVTRIINQNTTTDSAGLLVQAAVNAGNEIALFKNAAGTARMGIYANGNVGIGTESPIDKLTLSGRLNIIGNTQNSVWFNQSSGGSSTGFLVGRSYSSNDAQDFFVYDVATAMPRIRVLNTGDIEFYSYSTAGFKFSIKGGDTFNVLNAGNGGLPMYLNYTGNGAIYAGPSLTVLYAGSDERIKENINVVDSTLDKVLQLMPKTFNYKEKKNNNFYYGFIAQEVEQIFPELVKTEVEPTMCNDEVIENQKSIESYGLVWASILTKAIQELKAQNDDLQSQINELKAQ